MNKYIAVRAKTLTEAKNALEKSGVSVIKSNAERVDPAFRNLVEGFHARGMVYDITGCGIFWLLVQDDNSLENWQAFSAIECVIAEEWFVEQAQKVRYLKGMAYCDATSAWSELFPLKDQARKIAVQFEAPDEIVELKVEPSVQPQPVEDVQVELEDMPEPTVELAPEPLVQQVPDPSVVEPSIVEPSIVESSEPVSKGERSAVMQSIGLGFEFDESPAPVKKKAAKRPKRKRPSIAEEEQLDLFALNQACLLR